MHVLEPKQIKLNPEEFEKLIKELNISPVQLPKIRINDVILPEGCDVGDIVKIERKDEETGKVFAYYRVVSV